MLVVIERLSVQELDEMADAFDVLVGACRAMLDQRQEFWVLAGLSDRSYEEGDRSRDFRESVAYYAEAGVPAKLLDQLRMGINGNLAETIEQATEVTGPVKQNKSRVPDIEFAMDPHAAGNLVEVKLIYECTFNKYYRKVLEDREKLLKKPTEGGRFQIVFFVHFPKFYYPAGVWYRVKECEDRRSCMNRAGIVNQFAHLTKVMPFEPSWPDNAPLVRELDSSSASQLEPLIDRWFDLVFAPSDKSWQFDYRDALRDAAVGVAIWDHSTAAGLS